MPKDLDPKTSSRSYGIAVPLTHLLQCPPQDVDLVGLHSLLAVLGSLG
jgi:hypothetical protein